MPCPSHPPWLDHSNYTWRRVPKIYININWQKYISNFITGNTIHFTNQMTTDGRILSVTIYRSAHISKKAAKHLMEQVTFGYLQTMINISKQCR
jgi:hypothetical protein